MLFVAWPEGVSRPTRDLDFLGFGSPEIVDLKADMTEIFSVAVPDDGLEFDATTLNVDPIKELDEYQGARVKAKARLGSAVIPLQIDIGFGDAVYPTAQSLPFPNILDDFPQASVRMYPPETVVAEKLEAMVRFGSATTRFKDHYDIWVIASKFSFERATLVEALRRTFDRRNTPHPQDIPVALSAEFGQRPEAIHQWTQFVRNAGLQSHAPEFGAALYTLRAFIGPVLAVSDQPDLAIGVWDPDLGWQLE